jgi:PAS domain S-box-containing protein
MTGIQQSRWVGHPFDLAPIGLMVLDGALALLEANSYAWEASGADPASVGADPALLLRELAFPTAIEVLLTASAQVLRGAGTRRYWRWAWTRSEPVRHFDWQVRAIEDPASGERQVLISFAEVTRHVLAQDQPAAPVRVPVFLDGIPDPAWSADAEGRIEHFNRSWCEATGCEGVRDDGQWLTMVHPEDAVGAELAWCDALIRRVSARWCSRLRHGRDGTWRWHQFHARPSSAPLGAAPRWLVTCADVDELVTNLTHAQGGGPRRELR